MRGPGTGKVVLTSSDGIYSLKDLKDAYARMQSSGQYSATELQEMETIVKIAERRRYDFIRKSGGSDLETPRERQVYEGLSQIVGAGRTYAKDEDGVFSDFDGNWSSVEEALNDDAAFGGKKMASVVKGAAYAAGAEATQIKSSNKYAQAAANAKRASEAKKK